jgi:hypothetical protein
MELFEMNSRLQSKTIKPQVYAITLERPAVGMSVHLVVAFDLEEAIEKAKQSLCQMMKMTPEEANCWKMNLFMRRPFSEVLAEGSATDFTATPVKAAPQEPKRKGVEPSAKNKLMQQIVATKDVALFKKSKKQFTEAEVKYLTDQLR